MTAEKQRLIEDRDKKKNWRKFGPYLTERQWGTVREDYSADGSAWYYLSHDLARSRAYRWGEEGIAGISDDGQLLCFALSLWNKKDRIIKERFFGLSGPEGNHEYSVRGGHSRRSGKGRRGEITIPAPQPRQGRSSGSSRDQTTFTALA